LPRWPKAIRFRGAAPLGSPSALAPAQIRRSWFRMRTTTNKNNKNRSSQRRKSTNRRDFLRLERLEDRLALATAPVAVNDLYHTPIDEPLTITAPGILSNDSDADGDPLVAGLFSGPANGTLTLNEDGSFNYQPNADFTGLDSFIYFANDGALDSLLAAVTIRVDGDGTPPVASNDSYNVEEDGALTVAVSGGVLGNDIDAQGSAMTAALVAGPAHGTLALAADGSFTYLPTANFSGLDSFTYTASDASGASNVATATITVDAVNDKPTVANDAFNTDEDGVLTVGAAEGVLINDADLDGDTLTTVIESQPLHGTVSLGADGSFTYTPEADYNGLDGFSYFVTDGTTDSDVATATITIGPVNDLPAVVNDTYTTAEDTPLEVVAPGVLVNDSDIDGDALSAVLLAPPVHGTVTLGADGALLYTPDADYNGTDGFSYVASDGSGDSTVASVTITITPVNDGPIAVADAYSTDEDTTLTVAAAGLLANDSDVDGDSLAAALVAGPASGTLTVNADGSFSYTPNANFNGTDSFTYTAGDGSLTSTATVTLTVNAVNDVPAAANDEYTTAEDTPLTVAAPGLLGNDADPDGDAITAAIANPPTNGTVTVNADGSFTYTPNANFNGTDGFSYTVGDGTGTSEAASVTITVTPANDGPIAAADSYSTDEDTTLTIAASGVLGNDSDPDGDALSALLASGPASGTVTLNADGSFSYTPNANFAGTDSFSYTAGDGTLTSAATVSITVNATNDAPVAAADSYSTDEDTTLTIAATGVLGNDTDGDGDTMTAAIGTGPANGTVTLNADGSFSYTPNANFAGTDSFSYTASDGTVASAAAIVTITVNSVNDVPHADNDEYTTAEDTPLTVAAPGVLENDEDADGDPLTVSLVNPPSNGTVTLNADGSFTYTPNANFAGTDGFSYTVGDGATTSEAASVTINVTPANDGPAAAADAYSTDEDTTLTIAAPGVLSNDNDPDGDPLTTLLASGPANGTVTLNADGSFSYTPNANFSGTDSFTYTAGDGTLTSEAAVTITVNAVNDAPTAEADSYSTDEDTTLTVAAPGVLANDIDGDGDPLSAALVGGPANGTLTMNADGGFSYAPNANFTGTDSFTYTAGDATLASGPATVTISVNAANDAPVAAADVYLVNEDETLTVDISASLLTNDSDPDGDPLSSVLATGPANGTLSLAADGSFVYTPGANFNGTDSFTYTASDGALTSNLATVTLTVCPVNDAPVSVDDAYAVDEDSSLTIAATGVLGNDTDPESDPLSAALGTGPANGTLSLATDGSFVYTPNANFSGTDSFTYTASDGALTDEAVVTITVNPVADAPVAAIDNYSTGEDLPLIVGVDLGVLANDLDPAGDGLTAEVVTGPAHGTLTMNADGSFSYAPEANYHGGDSFTYKAISNGEEILAGANIVVEPLNDRPVAVDDEFTLGDGGPLAIEPASGVMANDSDIDGDTLTTNLVSGPAHGTLTLNPDGTFNYTPEEGFEGDDSFRYQLFDGKANSNVATVTLHVEEGPDETPTAPVAADDAFTVAAGETLTITAPGVLGNDTDPESDPLTATIVTGPANGTLTLNADGSFAYTPAASFTGTDTFTYQATDGEGASNAATVTITVEGDANLRPEAVNDSFAVESGATLDVPVANGLLGNDSDPEGAPLTASLFAGPLHGTLTLAADGSFSYASNAGYVGLDSFLYRVSDGELWSALAAVTLHVTASEDPEPAPVPSPVPTPTPEPEPCLTLDDADDLLDALVQADAQPDAVDAIFANGNWLA